jgi:peptide deformylase
MPFLPSDQLKALGILQEGESLLAKIAHRFDLPRETEEVRTAVSQLATALQRISQVHRFTKGMGLAAPQIGIDRAVAIVQAPEREAITLLNPRVVEGSSEKDEQYEGCLSFFDVRGKVPRSLTITVEHQDIAGTIQTNTFHKGLARLIAHEIDHLHGVLYRKRMRPGVQLIPVSQYRGAGQAWNYSET